MEHVRNLIAWKNEVLPLILIALTLLIICNIAPLEAKFIPLAWLCVGIFMRYFYQHVCIALIKLWNPFSPFKTDTALETTLCYAMSFLVIMGPAIILLCGISPAFIGLGACITAMLCIAAGAVAAMIDRRIAMLQAYYQSAYIKTYR